MHLPTLCNTTLSYPGLLCTPPGRLYLRRQLRLQTTVKNNTRRPKWDESFQL